MVYEAFSASGGALVDTTGAGPISGGSEGGDKLCCGCGSGTPQSPAIAPAPAVQPSQANAAPSQAAAAPSQAPPTPGFDLRAWAAANPHIAWLALAVVVLYAITRKKGR